MPKHRREPPRTTQQLSTKGFFDKYAHLLEEPSGSFNPTDRNRSQRATVQDLAAKRIPFQVAISQLDKAGFRGLLRAAQAENHPEAFKETLETLIHFLGVKAPEGVFTPTPKRGKVGRPISSEGERIYSIWRELGEPSPYKSDLAKAFFGALFGEASGTTRRQMRDRCRNALSRQFDREILKLENRHVEQEAELAKLRESLTDLKRSGQPPDISAEGLSGKSGPKP